MLILSLVVHPGNGGPSKMLSTLSVENVGGTDALADYRVMFSPNQVGTHSMRSNLVFNFARDQGAWRLIYEALKLTFDPPERTCDGSCEPACAFCRTQADQAASDRQAEWEGEER